MPVSLTEYTADRSTVEVPVGTNTLTVHYQPQRITPGDIARGRRAEADNTLVTEVVAPFLAHVVLDWDLLDSDEPVPPTLEAMSELPLGFLSLVFNAIMTDLSEGKARATSDIGSPPTAWSESTTTGTRSSKKRGMPA